MGMRESRAHDRRIFVDTRSIYAVQHVMYRTHTAEKLGYPVLEGDRSWERMGVTLYGTALERGDGGVQLWYQAWPHVPPKTTSSFVGYATSDDGIRFEKPPLGLVSIDGSKENNLVNLYRHQPSIMIDPDAPPEYRFKAVGFATDRHVPEEMAGHFDRPGFYKAHSADGLHWTEYSRPHHMAVRDYGDVGAFVRDEHRGLYVGTPKHSHRIGLNMRRSVHFTQSPDFEAWTEPRLGLAADELDDRMARERGFDSVDFYGLALLPYPDFYVGFLWVFFIREPFARVMLRKSHRQFHRGFGVYGRVEVQLVYSHDGLYWHRMPGRAPFIPWGERGDFDGGAVYTVNRPILRGDELHVYYCGTRSEHGGESRKKGRMGENHAECAIGLARIKRDRFASFSTDGKGMVEVDHGPLSGTGLRVNARCPHGYVKAELLDLDGNVLPGFDRESCVPFCGDHVDGVVRWTAGDLTAIKADEIRIRFDLFNADLFGYEVGDEGGAPGVGVRA